MRETALVILAAGIGSRYGNGLKQLAPVGPNGEFIMEYSIYDALEAGFDKVIFIIRKELEQDFRSTIGSRVSRHAPVSYAFQSLQDLPEGYDVPEGRAKPWGTGQAILCCRDLLDVPFVVINADDYYGKEGFRKIHDFLIQTDPADTAQHYCMAGFHLGNTLSENGGVTRGICTVDEQNRLTSVTETRNITKAGNEILAADADGNALDLRADNLVSMNMWGFTPGLLETLAEDFVSFLAALPPDDLKAEFLLPTIIDQMIHAGKADVTVLSTGEKWFGVTYAEDRDFVADSIQQLVKEGIYPENLF